MTGWEWQERAACRGLGHIMHVPDDTDLQAVWAARDVCKACPVIDACNAWAQTLTADTDPEHDVIAGHTWRERRSRRAAARVTTPAPAGGGGALQRAAAARREAIAELIGSGVSVSETARTLGIAKSTVLRHLQRLSRELAERAVS